MKKLAFISILLAMTGCGVPFHNSDFLDTAPGYPMPDGGIGQCIQTDSVMRCLHWKTDSNRCVNPKGHDAEPPVVPCASIQKAAGPDALEK